MQSGAFSCSRRGSRGTALDELPLSIEIEALTPEDAAGKRKMRASNGCNLPWGTIARFYIVDYTVLLVLTVALVISEASVPYTRFIFHKDDQELWRYSYPLHKDSVPSWSVPVIALCGPAAVIIAHSYIRQTQRLEVHNAVLNALMCVITTALITNLIKLGVGRPRPNFMMQCWPDGDVQWDATSGEALCSKNTINPAEGRKSFPSGHTSWSTSGLGYLTFWLGGKLRIYDGTGHSWRVPASLIPLGGAVWIGITRLQDYWHHWEDVTAGFLLGLGLAYAFYRLSYPSISSLKAGEPILPALEGGSNGEGTPQRVHYTDLEAANLGQPQQL
ncbi:g9057 [Coccomyxa elongata]